jgi:hypothetical protein
LPACNDRRPAARHGLEANLGHDQLRREPLAFYRQWGARGPAAQVKGPFLDPLNPQSPYSPVLLNLFRTLVQAPDYVQRLRIHYEMFRKTIARAERRRPASRLTRPPLRPRLS